jgi:hypothetical protein
MQKWRGNCNKIIIPKYKKEIWRQMQKTNFTKKRDLRMMSIQSVVSTSLAFQKALNVISLVSINFTELIVLDLFVCCL